MNKILVIGGRGFIGRSLCRKFYESGSNVFVLDTSGLFESKVLNHQLYWDKVVNMDGYSDFDAFFFLAGNLKKNKHGLFNKQSYLNRIQKDLSFFARLAASTGKKFVYFSSLYVSSSADRRFSRYINFKYLGEQICLEMFQDKLDDLLIVRPTRVFCSASFLRPRRCPRTLSWLVFPLVKILNYLPFSCVGLDFLCNEVLSSVKGGKSGVVEIYDSRVSCLAHLFFCEEARPPKKFSVIVDLLGFRGHRLLVEKVLDCSSER